MKDPQTLQVTLVFTTEHSPGTPNHLHEVARHYFEGKGIALRDSHIEI